MVSSETNTSDSDSSSRKLKKSWKRKKLAKLRRQWKKLKQTFRDSTSSSDESNSNRSIPDTNYEDNMNTLPQTMRGVQAPVAPEAAQTLEVENTIQPDVLSALGENPKKDGQIWGPEIHSEVANRWVTYLHKGITTEDKQKLIDTYPPPSNCAPLKPPTLNAEMVVALKNPITKQDTFLKNVQQLLATSLAALSGPLNKIVTDPETTMDNKTELLPALIDASKALAGAYQSLSMHRRYLITPSLKESHRKTVQDSPIDEHLFGTNLQESLKTSQAIKRMGDELSVQANKKTRYAPPVNFQASTSKQNFRKPASNHNPKYQRHKISDYQKKRRGNDQKRTTRRY